MPDSASRYSLVVSGSRHGRTDTIEALEAWVSRFGPPLLLILGDALGVDDVANFWWKSKRPWPVRRFRVEVKPELPIPRRFHERNERMVAMAQPGDHFLGLPIPSSRGTWHCAHLARRAGLVCWGHISPKICGPGLVPLFKE